MHKRYTFIWVRLFWNQNLTCNGSNPNSRLNSFLCLSSGCGHSLKKLRPKTKKSSLQVIFVNKGNRTLPYKEVYNLIKVGLTLPFLGSDAECGDDNVSFWGVDLDHHRMHHLGSHCLI